jgi:hypothetical protein
MAYLGALASGQRNQLRHACAEHLAPKINQLDLAHHLSMKDARTLNHYYAGNPERRGHKW